MTVLSNEDYIVLYQFSGNFSMFNCDKNKFVLGDSLKFFPLGFWVTYKKPDIVDLNLNKLTIDPNCGIDDTRVFDIDTTIIPPLNWPETPDDNSVVLFNSDLPLSAKPKESRL